MVHEMKRPFLCIHYHEIANLSSAYVMLGNGHGMIRKYELNMCRQCFKEKASDIGFIKVGCG